uniref:Uncharacterized protein n=1 Tax=Molossus molossus TaxID=27622 RepID=A0A7J8JVX8_MOLMO|nr:hypothetical protein HJG59_007996 [Molossus molossus]
MLPGSCFLGVCPGWVEGGPSQRPRASVGRLHPATAAAALFMELEAEVQRDQGAGSHFLLHTSVGALHCPLWFLSALLTPFKYSSFMKHSSNYRFDMHPLFSPGPCLIRLTNLFGELKLNEIIYI